MKHNPFHGFVAVFAITANMAAIINILNLSSDYHGILYPWAMIPVGLMAYIADILLFQKERKLNVLMGVNAFFFILGAFAFLYEGALHARTLIFGACFLMVSMFCAGQHALEQPTLAEIMNCFDVSVLVSIGFISYAVITKRLGTDIGILIAVPVLSCVLCICDLRIQRLGRMPSLRDWVLTLASMTGISAVMVFVTGTLAGGLGNLIVTVWHGMIYLAKALTDLLIRFMIWFFSLFPLNEAGQMDMQQLGSMSSGDTKELDMEVSPELVAIFLTVLVLIILVALIVYLRRLRVSIRSGTVSALYVVEKKRTPFWQAILEGIKRLLSKWTGRVKDRIYLYQHKYEAEGIYFTIVRKYRRSKRRKSDGETALEFLQRLAVEKNRVSNNNEISSADELCINDTVSQNGENQALTSRFYQELQKNFYGNSDSKRMTFNSGERKSLLSMY